MTLDNLETLQGNILWNFLLFNKNVCAQFAKPNVYCKKQWQINQNHSRIRNANFLDAE